MSKNDTKYHWMSLASENGRLVITLDENGTAAAANFVGISRGELLQMTARSLSLENRYCHQTREPVSVAQHSNCLHSFLESQPDLAHLADYGLVHDCPEGFLHDIPRMCKDEKRSILEDQVFRAFGWGLPYPLESPDDKIFHAWDSIAATAEAIKFGYRWWWVPNYEEKFGTHNVKKYLTFMEEGGWLRFPQSNAIRWQADAIKLCQKNGLRLDDKFTLGEDVLKQLTHD